MVVVGLTGGIGSGKSTVSAMLVGRGAVVVDADRLAREAVTAGTAAFRAVVERFGSDVVATDGSLDRRALAEIVFADPFALGGLNSIVHPPVRAAIAERLAELEGTEAVIVLEIPLLVESGRSYGESAVIVVDCPEEVALRRLVGRGMDEADARRRMAAQASRADRLAAADVVIDNSGPLEALEPQVTDLWSTLTARPTGDDRTRPGVLDRHRYRPEGPGAGSISEPEPGAT